MDQSLDRIDAITAAPPGTVLLHEGTISQTQYSVNRLLTFRTATGKGDVEHLITVPGRSDIVLQPQPSCDPNDPLVSNIQSEIQA